MHVAPYSSLLPQSIKCFTCIPELPCVGLHKSFQTISEPGKSWGMRERKKKRKEKRNYHHHVNGAHQIYPHTRALPRRRDVFTNPPESATEFQTLDRQRVAGASILDPSVVQQAVLTVGVSIGSVESQSAKSQTQIQFIAA
jgi:hypothetical protein